MSDSYRCNDFTVRVLISEERKIPRIVISHPENSEIDSMIVKVTDERVLEFISKNDSTETAEASITIGGSKNALLGFLGKLEFSELSKGGISNDLDRCAYQGRGEPPIRH